MNSRTGLLILRIALGVVVGVNSAALVVSQVRGHPQHALLVLGLTELVAAILFLIPRTVRLGGISLMVVFAAAALFHFLHGESSIGFLVVYAAGANAVVAETRRYDRCGIPCGVRSRVA
jgi:hypothetical protein